MILNQFSLLNLKDNFASSPQLAPTTESSSMLVDLDGCLAKKQLIIFQFLKTVYSHTSVIHSFEIRHSGIISIISSNK